MSESYQDAIKLGVVQGVTAVDNEGRTPLLEYIQENGITGTTDLMEYGASFEHTQKKLKEALSNGQVVLKVNDDTPIFAVKELNLTENMYPMEIKPS